MEKLAKFEIIEKIGEGGMGRVYKALDPVLHRKVAIKVIATSSESDTPEKFQELRERFVREARMIGSLQHPNIVTLFDFGEADGNLYMAMEFLDGTDLKTLMKSGTPVPLHRKLDIFRQICLGLSYAHAQGVIHRDLKPGNVHLLDSGIVKIVDFGLARMSESDLTKTGIVVGTPYYMSPEQIRGKKVDHRSDLFSLGSVVYEFLTGHRPFRGETVDSLLANILTAAPLAVREIDPLLPGHLDAILSRCLEKNVADRYADADQIRGDLDIVLKDLEEKWDTIERGQPPASEHVTTKRLKPPPSTAAPPVVEVRIRPAPGNLPEDTAQPGSFTSVSSVFAAIKWARRRNIGLVFLAVIAVVAGAFLASRIRPAADTTPKIELEEVAVPVPVPEGTPPAEAASDTQAGTDAKKPEEAPAERMVVETTGSVTPETKPPAPQAGRVDRERIPDSTPPRPVPVPQARPSDTGSATPAGTTQTGIGSVRVLIQDLPEGATQILVFIDGDSVAVDDPTRFIQDGLDAGTHRIRVTCDRCERLERTFVVQPDQETTVTISMSGRG